MALELKPETERVVRDELRRGCFMSADELIVKGVEALREKSARAQPAVKRRKTRPNLADFLMASPFAGSDIDLDRRQDYGRPVGL